MTPTQEKTFDESKISMLIDVLEAGVGLYDDEERTLLMMAPKEARDQAADGEMAVSDAHHAGAAQGEEEEEEAMVRPPLCLKMREEYQSLGVCECMCVWVCAHVFVCVCVLVVCGVLYQAL